jgi:hypothetical protein
MSNQPLTNYSTNGNTGTQQDLSLLFAPISEGSSAPANTGFIVNNYNGVTGATGSIDLTKIFARIGTYCTD